MNQVRPAAVAGMFYPARAEVLAADVDAFLRQAQRPAPTAAAPKALIAPHAGYVYSGAVAASAYARLAPLAERIERVVLFGPAHRVFVRGLALPAAGAFATPLGEVPVDALLADRALRLANVAVNAEAHAQEHSLEVQLPFLQRLLGRFTVLPVAVGAAGANEVAAVMDALWGGDETLIVVSSDLSHYHPYGTAREIDRATVEQVLEGSPWLDHDQACGATPINALILCAQARAMRVELIDLRNSGDTAGERSRVVGYAAFALYEGSADDA